MTRKHPPPFSLRLAPQERARLERDAGDMPLGSYIRSVLLGPRQGKRGHDPKTLAHVLALLGRSNLAPDLHQLAESARSGALYVEPETEAALRAACADIAVMKAALMRALGIKDH